MADIPREWRVRPYRGAPRRLDALLSSAPIDYVKWDFNRCFTDAGRPGEEYPQRLWVDHVRAFYALLDRLRAARLRPPAGGLSAFQYVLDDETAVLRWLQAQHYGSRSPAATARPGPGGCVF